MQNIFYENGRNFRNRKNVSVLLIITVLFRIWIIKLYVCHINTARMFLVVWLYCTTLYFYHSYFCLSFSVYLRSSSFSSSLLYRAYNMLKAQKVKLSEKSKIPILMCMFLCQNALVPRLFSLTCDSLREK